MQRETQQPVRIFDCVVVGGGPAGMAAAIAAARAGRTTALLEKNRRPGAKLLLTGGGRCNLTNLADTRGFVAAYGPGGNFLRAALNAFSPDNLCDFMRDHGVALVTEGAKVFARDGAAAVLAALEREMQKCGVEVVASTKVAALMRTDDGWTAVTYRGEFTAREKMILAPGGLTYTATGSSGDGYEWLERLGHTLVSPRPAAGPLALESSPFGVLAGVALERVRAEVLLGGKKSGSFEGALVFTPDGASGPVVLDAGVAIARADGGAAAELVFDFAPDCNDDALAAAFADLRKTSPGKALGNACPLPDMPNRLYRTLIDRAGGGAETKLAEAPKTRIRALVDALKRTRFAVTGSVPADAAMVTVGGVSTREIDARTMASLVAPGIFFAGEFIDIAGPCGGFNLQAAFSTGFLAGGGQCPHPGG